MVIPAKAADTSSLMIVRMRGKRRVRPVFVWKFARGVKFARSGGRDAHAVAFGSAADALYQVDFVFQRVQREGHVAEENDQ